MNNYVTCWYLCKRLKQSDLYFKEINGIHVFYVLLFTAINIKMLTPFFLNNNKNYGNWFKKVKKQFNKRIVSGNKLLSYRT